METTQEQRYSETTASDYVVDCYTDFGIHTHKSKIANVMDGLKPINRRILLIQNSNVKKKGPAITGVVMGEYHPYGDLAIGSALVRMSQCFKTRTNLMHCDMKNGDYYGDKAPALRYLSFSASPFAIDVYYKGVDHGVFEYQPSEAGNGKLEPKFFIPKLPMALLVGTEGIAIAHKSTPVNLNMGALCKMILTYIRLKLDDPKVSEKVLYEKLAKYTLPEYPMHVLLRNKKEVLNNYQKGKYKTSIYEEGTLDITPTTFTIKTLPYGKLVLDVWTKAGKDRKDNKVNFINSNFQRIEDYSKEKTEAAVIFTLKRGVNPFTILPEFKKYIGFSRRNIPSNLYTLPNDQLSYLNPITIMEIWFKERGRAIKAELRAKQRKYAERIRVLNVFIHVGDNIRNVASVLIRSNTIDDAYPILSKKYDLTKAQVNIIAKYRLGSLVKQGKEELIEELESIKEDVKELRTNFTNVELRIAEDCKSFLSNYPEYCERNCDEDSFIGCLSTLGGVIQFSDIEELLSLLCTFNKSETSVTLYPSTYKYRYLLDNLGVQDESKLTLPKQCVGDTIVAYKTLPKYTVGVGAKPKTVFRHNDIAHTNSKDTVYTHVGDECTVIRYGGKVELLKTKTLVNRANIKSKGVRDDIVYVSRLTLPKLLIVYTRGNNEVILEQLTHGDKFIMPPGSVVKTTILGVFNPTLPVFINIPKSCLNKCVNDKIYIEDPSLLSEGKTIIKLNVKHHKYLTLKRITDAHLVTVT